MEKSYLGHKYPLLCYAEALIVAQREKWYKLLPIVLRNARTPKDVGFLSTEGVIAPKYYKK